MYDMKHLAKLGALGELSPRAFKAFQAFDEAAFKEGELSVKHKELIAIGVALATQCPYCIAVHSELARKAGANQKEIAEAVLVAAAIRAGGAVTHGTHALWA